jgi:hypothetical protein
MYQEDNYNLVESNDYDNEKKISALDDPKIMDRGYNIIYRNVMRKDGKLKNKKIEIYTSSDVGNHIRDAETGEYYPNLVGSKDEELFYKVGLSTGECKSANGSSTLFYLSPQHYATHLHCSIDPEQVQSWELKRKARLFEINENNKKNANFVEVR